MNDLNAMWSTVQTALGGQIPHLLGALAILVLGWLVAVVVRAGARRGLGLLGLNKRFAQLTGEPVNLERGVAIALFWVVLLFTLAAVFNSLDLTLVSGPFAALANLRKT